MQPPVIEVRCRRTGTTPPASIAAVIDAAETLLRDSRVGSGRGQAAHATHAGMWRDTGTTKAGFEIIAEAETVFQMIHPPQGRPAMPPDPDRKPTRQEMRQGGMVAAAVLVFLAVFTAVIVWIA